VPLGKEWPLEVALFPSLFEGYNLLNLTLYGVKLLTPIPRLSNDTIILQTLSLVHCLTVGPLPDPLPRSLRTLDIQWTNFGGTIPASYGKYDSSSVDTIRLEHSLLYGPLPRTLPMTISHLRLSGNKLTGKIPTPWFNDTNYPFWSTIYLDDNMLEGPLPDALPTFLDDLNLGFNSFTGTIPPAWSDSGFLTSFVLNNNKLQGTIPDLTTASTKKIDLSFNNFSGTIPEGYGLFALTHLNLGNNSLNGTISHWFFESSSSITVLDLSNNQLKCPPTGSPRYDMVW